MRDIKFRAWDKAEEEMLNNDAVFGNELCVLSGYQDEDFIFMQYTGLQDRQGVEIYEGDILEVITFGFESESFISSIIFDKAGFRLSINRNLFYFGQKNYKILDDARVIGNIYEHPHLLHVKDEA